MRMNSALRVTSLDNTLCTLMKTNDNKYLYLKHDFFYFKYLLNLCLLFYKRIQNYEDNAFFKNLYTFGIEIWLLSQHSLSFNGGSHKELHIFI